MAITANDIGRIVTGACDTLRDYCQDFDRLYYEASHKIETGETVIGEEEEEKAEDKAWNEAEAELERWQRCSLSFCVASRIRELMKPFFRAVDARDVGDYAATYGGGWQEKFGGDWMLETIGCGTGFFDRRELGKAAFRLSAACRPHDVTLWRDGDFLKIEG